MIPLVQQLSELRKQSGMSIDRLAERSGYDRRNLMWWFSGHTRPLLSSFVDLANALGYDVVLVKREAS